MELGSASPTAAGAASFSIRQLRYFVTVADELHFGRASRRLHITQPALSQQIARLEAIVGGRLLDRERTTVGLTDAGRVFADEARAVVQTADRAVEMARRAMTTPAISVSYCPSIEWTLMSELAAAVQDLEVAWTLRVGEGVTHEIVAGHYDIALARCIVATEDITREVLLWEQAAAYLSPQDPLAQRPEIRLEDLRGRRIRMFHREHSPRQYALTLEDLERAGLDVDTSHPYRFGMPMVQEVSAGDYVAMGSVSARNAFPDMAVVPLAAGMRPIPVTLVRRAGDHRPQIEELVRIIRRVAADTGPLASAPWRVPAAAAQAV